MTVTEYLRPEHWRREAEGPRYVQLRKRIEEAIETGVLLPDAPLPPEREIAALTDLSRVTVRKAIQELVDRGLVVQRQGSGSFVRERPLRVEQSLSRLTSFSEDMARRGLTSTSTWLEKGIFVPSPDEVVALALSSGDGVSRITRLREAGGRPMAIERASLPVDLLPDPEAVTRSLYEALERDGNRPIRAIQKISAINLDDDTAARLGVPPGAAGLKIERTSYLPSGRVVEFTRSIYRGDAYDFVAELRLPPA
ncbi:GntR family transcriptional regulator [Palleronia sp. KMU-117]|uniref:GntR family transcriptional regulator n=1 Tax=Palleronia sp. KMU-117 TaxID=3434108 RepID=UPI003D7304E9